MKNRSISSAPHRAVLVARQAGDLGILVPAHGSRAGSSRAWRRSTTRFAVDVVREPRAGGASPDTLYHRPHAPLERDRGAGRGHDEDLREDGDPRRLPRRRSTPDELPVAAVFLTGRPFPETDQRTIGVGWAGDRAARSCGSRARTPTPCAGRTTARRDVALGGRGRPERGRARAAGPGRRADPARGRATRSRRSRRPGRRGQGAICSRRSCARAGPRTAAAIVKVLTGELRIGLREGLLEAAIAKAFDRPLDEVKRAGMLTGDIGRTAVLAREDRLGDAAIDAVPPAQVHARVAGRGRRRDRRAGSGPPSGSRTSTTASARQLHRRGDEVRLYSRDLTTSAGSSPRSSRARAACRGPGSSTARSWPTGRRRPAVPPAPGAARAQEPVGEDPRGRPGRSSSRGTCSGWTRDQDAVGRRPLLERPLTRAARRRSRRSACRWRRTAAASRSATSCRWTRSMGSSPRSRRRGRVATRACMVKDPTSGYSPGRRGLGWLKMKKALATIDCVVVGVEVGPRQAPRRPVGLHVRGPRRGDRASS